MLLVKFSVYSIDIRNDSTAFYSILPYFLFVRPPPLSIHFPDSEQLGTSISPLLHFISHALPPPNAHTHIFMSRCLKNYIFVLSFKQLNSIPKHDLKSHHLRIYYKCIYYCCRRIQKKRFYREIFLHVLSIFETILRFIIHICLAISCPHTSPPHTHINVT